MGKKGGLCVKPFHNIRLSEPAVLLSALIGELPQTIALVLSFMEPNKSSVILEGLPLDQRADVIRRISIMGTVDSDTVREIERSLELKMAGGTSYERLGGVESAVEILNLMEPGSQRGTIEELEDCDPELAEDIKKKLFVFEDCVMISDHHIGKVRMELEPGDLEVALIDVDSEVQDKFLSGLSGGARDSVRRNMMKRGEVNLREVEAAQNRILDVVKRLEVRGEIEIPKPGVDEYVKYDGGSADGNSEGVLEKLRRKIGGLS